MFYGRSSNFLEYFLVGFNFKLKKRNGQSLINDWYPDYGGVIVHRNVGTLLSDHKEHTSV